MKISIIVAAAKNNIIGSNNKMLWHITEDLQRFKKLTVEKTVIMGRKTWDSLPYQPLPKRRNIIISKQKNIRFKGAEVVNSPKAALAICQNEKEVFIIGGGTIYAHFLPLAHCIYLTRIHENFEGDTFFPDFDTTQFSKTKSLKEISVTGKKLSYSFIDYKKIKCEN